MIGGNIHETRKRSNGFVKDIDFHIENVIIESKEPIIKKQQGQLQESKLSTGQPITPLYSEAYAKRKGYKKPDGFLTGEMYKEMDVFTNEKNYFMTSFAPHTGLFVNHYGDDVFGIMKENLILLQQSVTRPRFKRLYNRLVLQR